MSEFEFERGREAGVKWGERLEQERIIALLEEVKYDINWNGATIVKAIDLIKAKTPVGKRYFGCEGCGQEQGTEGENNFCSKCQSYKYFGWMNADE